MPAFAITTTTPSPKLDPKRRAEVAFTITNQSGGALRARAEIKADDATQASWLKVADAEREFAADGVQQFVVTITVPESAPQGTCKFRLNVISTSKRSGAEESVEGPSVSVPIPAPATKTTNGPPWWIFLVIAAVVLLVGGGGVAWYLSTRPPDVETPDPTPALPPTVPVASGPEQCFQLTQDKIAWDDLGSKRWDPTNIQNLCRGTSRPTEPPRCFDRAMHGSINWGGGTTWQWKNALDLCAGTNDADGTIACFQGKIAAGVGWQEAIRACKATN